MYNNAKYSIRGFRAYLFYNDGPDEYIYSFKKPDFTREGDSVETRFTNNHAATICVEDAQLCDWDNRKLDYQLGSKSFYCGSGDSVIISWPITPVHLGGSARIGRLVGCRATLARRLIAKTKALRALDDLVEAMLT